MRAQKLYHIITRALLHGPTAMVKGAKDQLHRDPLQRLVPRLRHLLTEAEQHGRENERGVKLELGAMGRGRPPVGQLPHPLGQQKGILTAPAAPIPLADLRGGPELGGARTVVRERYHWPCQRTETIGSG